MLGPDCRSDWQRFQLASGAHGVRSVHLLANAPAAVEALLHFVHQQKVFLIGEMFKHKEERMHGALLVRRGCGPRGACLHAAAVAAAAAALLCCSSRGLGEHRSTDQLQLQGKLHHLSPLQQLARLACSRPVPA